MDRPAQRRGGRRARSGQRRRHRPRRRCRAGAGAVRALHAGRASDRHRPLPRHAAGGHAHRPRRRITRVRGTRSALWSRTWTRRRCACPTNPSTSSSAGSRWPARPTGRCSWPPSPRSHRVLRPGGVASITLQVALGAADAHGSARSPSRRSRRCFIAPYDWLASDDLDVTLDDATRANPELVRQGDGREVVDVHLALQTSPQPTGFVPPAERTVSGPREAVAALAKHLPDAVVGVDAGVRWGFPDAWEALGAHVRLIGFDPDREECARLERATPATSTPPSSRSRSARDAGTATYRTYAFAGVNTLLDPVVPTSAHGDEQPLATEAGAGRDARRMDRRARRRSRRRPQARHPGLRTRDPARRAPRRSSTCA